MEENEKPAGNETSVPEPAPPARRPRRKRSLKLDKEKVVSYVLKRLDQDLEDRQPRLALRMARYAKLRGWLPSKPIPYANCSNAWLPVMLTASLRTRALLENSGKAMRPLMNAMARQKRNVPKQKSIDDLIDYQVFTENQGEAKIDAICANYVDDEAVFVFTHWVKEIQTINDVRILPSLLDGDHVPQILAWFADSLILSEANPTMIGNDGWKWRADYSDENGQPATAVVEFFDRDDGSTEAHISRKAETYNGPVFEVMDFEDVVFPVRAANLQPPGPSNPLGAPYFNRICKTSKDAVRRGKKNGTYDITDGELEKIVKSKSATGSGQGEEEPKEQKDEMEGVEPTFGGGNYDDFQMIEHYGRWDVDGDGLEEDVIFWIARDARVLCKTALLTEIYPGLPVMRPVHHESFIPVPNRVYGLSLGELLESIQDVMQTLLNQHIDWGTIMNIPWFFYRAASGLKPEALFVEPGMGIPLDDPTRDVSFPQFPQKDSSYAINTMTILQQFAERISMLSDVQYGRVPTGKASALRTLGTTMSLLAQGDVRSEQVLRRLFHLVARVYSMIHRLNHRYLPKKKEIRVIGMSPENEEAYKEIGTEQIDADVDFEFRATMLNTNKQVLSGALSEAAALLVSPLAIQFGIVSEGEVYELMRDKLKSLDLDPDKYVKRPPTQPPGPKIMAEEALSAILANENPVGTPLEPAAEHLQKLIKWGTIAREKNLINTVQAAMLNSWIEQVKQIAMTEYRRQSLMAAAAAQGQGGNGGEGPGGVPSTFNSPEIGQNPPVNSGELIDESVGGGMQ